jgi:hypothetical protein
MCEDSTSTSGLLARIESTAAVQLGTNGSYTASPTTPTPPAFSVERAAPATECA